jgi:hypothetical protein
MRELAVGSEEGGEGFFFCCNVLAERCQTKTLITAD